MKFQTIEDRYKEYCDWCIVRGMKPAEFDVWQKVVNGVGASLQSQLEPDASA